MNVPLNYTNRLKLIIPYNHTVVYLIIIVTVSNSLERKYYNTRDYLKIRFI